MKKINIDTLSAKSVYFAIGIVLLTVYSILNHNTIAQPGMNTINIIFIALTILISVAALLIHSSKTKKFAGVIDIMISVALVVLNIVIYILPFWGFIGMKGANNAVGMVFTFVLYAMFLIEISIYLKRKDEERTHKILRNQKSNGARCYAGQLFKCIAVFLVVMSFIFAVLTLFIPNMLFLPECKVLKNINMVKDIFTYPHFN